MKKTVIVVDTMVCTPSIPRVLNLATYRDQQYSLASTNHTTARDDP